MNSIVLSHKSLISLLIAIQLSLLVPLSGSGHQSSLKSPKITNLEKEIVEELNFARSSPGQYINKLERFLTYFKGRVVYIPGRIPVRTLEGTSAVKEAIRYMKRQKPLKKFKVSHGMSRGAMDHVKDTGPRGILGHYGSDRSNPGQRVNRYGKWLKTVGENIGYGFNTAELMVMQLIVDDGVPGRGHRKSIFNSRFSVIGVAFGSHRTYRHMVVITFAGGYIDR